MAPVQTELGKSVEAEKNRINEPINASTAFVRDVTENINRLAKEAYPDNDEKRINYANKIRQSLGAYLQKPVETLWEHLATEGCDTTAIRTGILYFSKTITDADGKPQHVEIDIAKFLKPIELPAQSTLDRVHLSERQSTIGNTQLALKQLLEELQHDIPNLEQDAPKLPPSYVS